MDNPEILGEIEIKTIQPYAATKSYTCPGCNREIKLGTGHLVVIPLQNPDLRRHWHRGCWKKR
tara:strand:+ start:436 stop:624 length:189 start_codon:yes stop_codon:yes gene_type:complete